MPLVLALLSGACSNAVVLAIVTRAAIALGVSVVTYAGVSVGMSALNAQMATYFNAGLVSMEQFMAICHIPQALNVIASAFVSSLALKGLTGANILRRVNWGGAGGVFTS